MLIISKLTIPVFSIFFSFISFSGNQYLKQTAERMSSRVFWKAAVRDGRTWLVDWSPWKVFMLFVIWPCDLFVFPFFFYSVSHHAHSLLSWPVSWHSISDRDSESCKASTAAWQRSSKAEPPDDTITVVLSFTFGLDFYMLHACGWGLLIFVELGDIRLVGKFLWIIYALS